ncbi:MAG: ABC-F type ribosomal protection protein [Candidatus Delongbacteria bacterium]|nr:ABC-F type ribosomal protection protein [Candidatus Delongbacteria bacterium]MCG2760512.1 ABC-F type ribosomal protection protein [Candidatus Delongbacteria bacterium]
MLYIQGRNISFKYEEAENEILKNISFTVDKDSKIGLIGSNGCGKTTLLKILLGQLPFEGDLHRNNADNVAYLPQEPGFDDDLKMIDYFFNTKPELGELRKRLSESEENNADAEETVLLWYDYEKFDGFRFEADIERIAGQFGFCEEDLERAVSSFSGGEKTKLALASLLLSEPDLLILDEPTNHIDEDSLVWLENYLRNIKTPYIVVSHDRKFLDNCTRKIWELGRDGLKEYGGNYSLYRQEQERELNYKIEQQKTANRKIKQLKQAYSDRKQWAETHQASTGTEGNAKTYNSITNFAKYAMQKAKNIETRMEKLIEKAESEKPFIEKKRSFSIEGESKGGNVALRVEDLSFGFSGKFLFDGLSFELNRNDRLAVCGQNGSGKSTLLKLLTGNLTAENGTVRWSPSVKIGYYAQEFENLDFSKTILEEVTQGNNLMQSKARTLLGCLKIEKDMVFRPISGLSIGERSKTALAKILMTEPTVLILDEPTNHLEIESREALENAIMNYQGTLIVVSHDRYFREKVTDKMIELILF